MTVASGVSSCCFEMFGVGDGPAHARTHHDFGDARNLVRITVAELFRESRNCGFRIFFLESVHDLVPDLDLDLAIGLGLGFILILGCLGRGLGGEFVGFLGFRRFAFMVGADFENALLGTVGLDLHA